ncbi:hypothetical protein [Streptomyces phaeochromogenes]|uniref:hypothetical protein n=1 Tax=Streptomyces phaeochromogenes TaxID=1923 RepID=UPI0038658659|nr:hypothetical protein OHB08_29460 [Streptomyces phaeochromogenes]
MTSIAAVLLGAAACGGDGESVRDKPLSQSELSRAVLTQGDMPGYKFFDESRAKKDRSARAATKSCQPIVAFAMAPEVSAYDNRLARQSITKGEKPDASYQLTLTSIESESVAEEALKELESAVSACGSGFNVTIYGEEEKIRRITADKNTSGNSEIGFSLEYQRGIKIRYAVMRQGATLARISAAHQSMSEFVAVPQRIIDKQIQKLEKAAK